MKDINYLGWIGSAYVTNNKFINNKIDYNIKIICYCITLI